MTDTTSTPTDTPINYTGLLDALKLHAQDRGFLPMFEAMLGVFDETGDFPNLHAFAKQCRAKGGLRGRDPGQWRPRAYATLAILAQDTPIGPSETLVSSQPSARQRKKAQLLGAVTLTQESGYRISLNEAADFFLTDEARAEVLDVLRDRDIACGDRLLASLTGMAWDAVAVRSARTPKAPKSTPETEDTAKAKAPEATPAQAPVPAAPTPVVAKDPIDAAVDAFVGLVAALAPLVATDDPSVEQRLWDAVAARSAQVMAPFCAVPLEVESPNRLETLLSILGNEALSVCSSVVAVELATANVVAAILREEAQHQLEPEEPPPTKENQPAPVEENLARARELLHAHLAERRSTEPEAAPETPAPEAAPEEPALDYDPLSALLD